ncbi:M20/M25/M40 family metallo-hydrolase [uncultured Draconibacterium sp.]|uniref:M28 family metallopeptidase n=1 Tax=uncultured Draconibacterium sp. TaxID=1573823 RepID=UPI0032180C47
MFQQKTVLSSLFLFCFNFLLLAQSGPLDKIDIDDLKRNLTFIASDKLQGRKLGTEVDGLGICADFLAENAKRIGLKPAVENYFQPVNILGTKPQQNNFIEIQNKKGKLVFRTNSLVALNSSSESSEFETDQLVFVGFGDEITDDIEEKVVVLAQGNAESFLKDEFYRWDRRLEQNKIADISEKKPKAILIVANPNDKENKTYNQINTWFKRERFSLASEAPNNALSVVLTKADFADKLLGAKGSFKKYLTEVATGEKSELPDIRKTLKVKIEKQTNFFESKNVIGVVEGSDPILKNEYVVFMAHYDHLGIGKDGDVYNGADDNGSGTVALLEVAEAFMSLDKKPKRSIVFLWVTCEELGHFGSGFYCDHPVFPLEKTVAAINLDMVGRVYNGPQDDVWKDSPKKVKDFDGLYTLTNDVWPELANISAAKCKELGLVPDSSLPKNPFLRASDHYNFHKSGVPILNYATGYHADYHKVGDEVSKINFEKIKRVADLCFLVGLEVANKNHIEFLKEQNVKNEVGTDL